MRAGTTGTAKMPIMEFADFNRDGMMDIAFASETGVLSILYNQFSAPGPKSTNLCSDVNDIKSLAERKIFPTYPFKAGDNGVTQVKLSDSSNHDVTFMGLANSMPSGSNEPAIPGRLRINDLDMDGFPDLAMTLAFKNSTHSFSLTTILRNEAGDDGERKLQQVKRDDGSYLSKVLRYASDDTAFLSFIDLDDDGKLDFLMQKEDDTQPTLNVIYNNI